MGCDIHIYAEVRNKKTKKWEKVGEVFKDYDGSKTDEPYIGRSYNLFAILANVRNGYGFAGVETGEGYEPIDMPRGLPDDVSEEVREISDGWGINGHSRSYLLLKELLDFGWENKSTVCYGVVEEEGFKEFIAKGKPSSWSGDIGGREVVKVTNEEMEALIAGRLMKEKGKSYCTRVGWRESYYDSASGFVDKTLPSLKSLGSPNDVRIVFFFDN